MERTNLHLMLLRQVKKIVFLVRNDGAINEKNPSADSQGVFVAQEEATVSLANQRAIPEGTIAGQVFGVDKGSDIVRFLTVVDNRIDPHVLV